MKKIRYALFALLVMVVSACGGSGDTSGLKQIAEQNKNNISSIILKSKTTQTLNPVNSAGVTPSFYFADNSLDEQITVIGLNDLGEEFALSNYSFKIIDDANSAGSSIDEYGNLQLEILASNTTKEIIVEAEFGTVTGIAKIVISSYRLQASGLNLLINNALVNATSQPVTVCDATVFTATGVFGDGSTRSITRKIDWPASVSDANAKFDVSDTSRPFFTTHTNGTYTLSVAYHGEIASVDLQVGQANFLDMIISPVSKTLSNSNKLALKLTAQIKGVRTSNIESRANWTSADANFVTVNATTGEVTAKKVGGPIVITATCGSAVQTSSITVN